MSMNTRDVIEAHNVAAAEVGPVIIPLCEGLKYVHAWLAAAEAKSGFVRAAVLRAVMGWVTQARRELGCR